jgi:hypothetical protein
MKLDDALEDHCLGIENHYEALASPIDRDFLDEQLPTADSMAYSQRVFYMHVRAMQFIGYGYYKQRLD